MASKKPANPLSARLKALHKLGLATTYRDPRQLTKNQKSRVSKIWSEYHEIATAPKGEFVKRNVANLGKETKAILKKTGYKVIGDTAYLPKQGYDTAKLKVEHDYNEQGKLVPRAMIKRTKGGRVTETEFLGSNIERMDWRDRLIDQYQSGQFKDNDFVGAKFFDGGRWKRRTFTNLGDLLNYLPTQVNWNTKNKETQDLLLNNVHLVKLEVRDFSDIGANELDKTTKGKRKYQRKKARKATATKHKFKKI